MQDQPYANREIQEMFTSHDREDVIRHQAIMARCETILSVATEARDQARLTNGRVNVLEKINENKKGAMRIVFLVAIPLVSLLLGWLGWISNNIASIHTTLTAYEITVQK